MGPGDGRGALMPLMEPAGAGPSFTLGFGRRRAGIGISYTLKEWDADYAGLSVKCVTGSRRIWSVASVVDEKSPYRSLTKSGPRHLDRVGFGFRPAPFLKNTLPPLPAKTSHKREPPYPVLLTTRHH